MEDKSEGATCASENTDHSILTNPSQRARDINNQMASFLRAAEEAFRKARALSLSRPEESSSNNDNSQSVFPTIEKNSGSTDQNRFP